VRRRTAKKSLPCDQKETHGKEHKHDKQYTKRTATTYSRQRHLQTHGKEATHGKEENEPTTKKRATAKVPSIAVQAFYAVRPEALHGNGAFAVRHEAFHGKGVFAVRLFLCRAQYRFFIFFHFHFILINTYVYFSISFIFC
jgi:hypothetical protein